MSEESKRPETGKDTAAGKEVPLSTSIRISHEIPLANENVTSSGRMPESDKQVRNVIDTQKPPPRPK